MAPLTDAQFESLLDRLPDLLAAYPERKLRKKPGGRKNLAKRRELDRARRASETQEERAQRLLDRKARRLAWFKSASIEAKEVMRAKQRAQRARAKL